MIKCLMCEQTREPSANRPDYYCVECNELIDASMRRGSDARKRKAAQQWRILKAHRAARRIRCPWCGNVGMKIESYISPKESFLLCPECGSRGPLHVGAVDLETVATSRLTSRPERASLNA